MDIRYDLTFCFCFRKYVGKNVLRMLEISFLCYLQKTRKVYRCNSYATKSYLVKVQMSTFIFLSCHLSSGRRVKKYFLLCRPPRKYLYG